MLSSRPKGLRDRRKRLLVFIPVLQHRRPRQGATDLSLGGCRAACKRIISTKMQSMKVLFPRMTVWRLACGAMLSRSPQLLIMNSISLWNDFGNVTGPVH